MWGAYDAALGTIGPVATEVNAQLDRIHDVGINTIRVWLSFWFYEQNPPAGPGNPTGYTMAQKFDQFLAECEDRNLYVIPILWDNVGFPPETSSFAGQYNKNFIGWRSSPGSELIDQQQGQLSTLQSQYVIDMIAVAAGHANVLMWDAMNEPSIDPSSGASVHQLPFIQNTLDLIKAQPQTSVTTVSPASWEWDTPEFISLAHLDSLDVLSFHFYSYGQRDIEGRCDNIKTIMSGTWKPIIANEAALVASGQSYPDIINLLTRVPSQYTGNPSPVDGVGFCLFSAMVGQPLVVSTPTLKVGNYPFADWGDGLFYESLYDITAPAPAHKKFVRDYTTPSAIDSLVAAAALHQWTVVPSIDYVPAEPFVLNGPNINVPMDITVSPHEPGYSGMVVPDGTHRQTLTGLFQNASSKSDSCSFYGTFPNIGVRQKRYELEMRFALEFFNRSVYADKDYHLSYGNYLFDPSFTTTAYTAYKNLASNFNPSVPADWTNPIFQGYYDTIFSITNQFWLAGGYDLYYQ